MVDAWGIVAIVVAWAAAWAGEKPVREAWTGTCLCNCTCEVESSPCPPTGTWLSELFKIGAWLVVGVIIGTGWLLQGVWVLGQWVTKHWVSETGGKKSPELGSRKIKEGKGLKQSETAPVVSETWPCSSWNWSGPGG